MFLQLDNLDEAVNKIADNQIVGIPTETVYGIGVNPCLLYTSPSPRDRQKSRMPSSA